MNTNTEPKNNRTSEGLQTHPEQAFRNTNPLVEAGIENAYDAQTLNSNLSRFGWLAARSNPNWFAWDGPTESFDVIRIKLIYKLTRWHSVYSKRWPGYANFVGCPNPKPLRIRQIADAAVKFLEYGEAYGVALGFTLYPAEANAWMGRYYGWFDRDEYLAMKVAEDAGIPSESLPAWPHKAWSAIARRMMPNFIELGGHYFRKCNFKLPSPALWPAQALFPYEQQYTTNHLFKACALR